MRPPALHDMLRDSVARAPERVVFWGPGERRTTYGELERDSGRFAAALVERGVRPGDRVAVVLDAVVEVLVATYGILKAGAATLPLSPEVKAHGLCAALAHSGAKAVVIDGGTARQLSGQRAAVPELSSVVTVGEGEVPDPGDLRVESYADLLAGSAEVHDCGARGEDLAFIVYTSGTTGQPKGVMLAHRSVCANIRSIVEYLALGPDDTVAMVLPPYYVYGSSVLHTHVCAGGAIAAVGNMTFPAQVLAGMQEHRCTGLSGVPSTFARLLSFNALERFDLGSLRMITQAGAAMTVALAQRLRARFPHVRLYVMYGQAEASARLAYVPPEELDRKIGSAGKAIPGVTLRIRDAESRPVPPGVVGEIVAQGDNLMLGYWRDPVETARVLRPDGLHTGDLARMDEDGFLFIEGRASEMIKSGAHRIAPKEIEEVVEKAEEVAECAVIGVPDELLGEAIVAFVVPRPGATVDPRRIQRLCLDHLPRFKVPSRVLPIDALPRTPTGKLQRLALREVAAPPLASPVAVRVPTA